MRKSIAVLILLFSFSAYAGNDYVEIYLQITMNTPVVRVVGMEGEKPDIVLKNESGEKVRDFGTAIEVMEAKGYEMITNFLAIDVDPVTLKEKLSTRFLFRKTE